MSHVRHEIGTWERRGFPGFAGVCAPSSLLPHCAIGGERVFFAHLSVAWFSQVQPEYRISRREIRKPMRVNRRTMPGCPRGSRRRMIGLAAVAVAALLTFAQTHATVVISEFMASNSGTLRDDFGDASDWIELHNTGDAPVNLQGWALTDRPGAASRWFFPSQVIEPDTYLVVFASGRNRKLPGAPLHTSFSLSAGGEYLALLRPNGTAATEFSPAFPRQVPDVSFGFPPTSTTTVVGPGAAGQAGVPTSLEDFELNFAGWQTSTVPLPGSSWQEIQTGVGYDRTSEGVPYGSWIGPGGNLEARMRNLNESAFIRIPFLIDDTVNRAFAPPPHALGRRVYRLSQRTRGGRPQRAAQSHLEFRVHR